ncbi:MAG: hypothetical protein FWG10_04310 [Eubacteriaceae bacterium]|nr:hypothetical protein [Eubacteriaceae bacterium]
MSEQKCFRCDKLLVDKKTAFLYLGRNFTHEVPCCPKCNKVYIPMSLAEGRIADVERELEDK